MDFLYPLLNYLQPGDLLPAIAPAKPMLILSLIAGLLILRRGVRPDAALTHSYLKHPALAWMCVFVLVNVISVYYSGILEMLQKLAFWEVYPLFVILSLLMLRDAASLRRYVWGSILGSGFVIYYALHAVAVHAPTIIGGRAGAYGMYQNQNDYTFIIIMILPFAYLYLRTCKSVWQRWLLVAVLVGGVIGVVLSLSRGGILALVLEAALLLCVTLEGGRRSAALLGLALLGTMASVHQFNARELDQKGQYTLQDSEDTRFQLWYAALEVFKGNPILGVGSGRFNEFAPEYAPISHDDRGKVAHDTYLEVAADTGLLGLGSFFLMLWAIGRSLRGARLADASGDGVIEAQLAALVAFLSILFRACFDAKVYDWSFYFLATVAIATVNLAPRTRAARAPLAASPSGRRERTIPARPAVYRMPS
jgi:O-antigen ligase